MTEIGRTGISRTPLTGNASTSIQTDNTTSLSDVSRTVKGPAKGVFNASELAKTAGSEGVAIKRPGSGSGGSQNTAGTVSDRTSETQTPTDPDVKNKKKVPTVSASSNGSTSTSTIPVADTTDTTGSTKSTGSSDSTDETKKTEEEKAKENAKKDVDNLYERLKKI